MSFNSSLRQNLNDWFPLAMRYIGLIGVIAEAFQYFHNGKIDTGLLTTFGTMMGISLITQAVAPPPVPTAKDVEKAPFPLPVPLTKRKRGTHVSQ